MRSLICSARKPGASCPSHNRLPNFHRALTRLEALLASFRKSHTLFNRPHIRCSLRLASFRKSHTLSKGPHIRYSLTLGSFRKIHTLFKFPHNRHSLILASFGEFSYRTDSRLLSSLGSFGRFHLVTTRRSQLGSFGRFWCASSVGLIGPVRPIAPTRSIGPISLRTNPGAVVKKWRRMALFRGQEAPITVLGAAVSKHKPSI